MQNKLCGAIYIPELPGLGGAHISPEATFLLIFLPFPMLLFSLPFRILLEQCPQQSPTQEPSQLTLPLGYPPMAEYKLFEDS